MSTRYQKLHGHRALLAAVAIGSAMTLTACTAATVAPTETSAGVVTEEQAEPMVLVVGQAQPLAGNFNGFTLSIGNNMVVYNLYDTLVRTGEGLKPEPRLAETWEFADDNLSMTLNLREATFADGTPITSKHVATSLAFAQNAENGANAGPLARRVTSIDTSDDNVVVLNFDTPFPSAFDLLNLLIIVDQETIDSVFAEPNASGPFKLDSYQPEIGYTLVANEAFWGTPPKLATIEVKFLNNTQTLTAAIRSGDIDFIAQTSALDAMTYKDDPNYVGGLFGGANSVVALNINVTDPALSDPRVRLALSRSLNRDRMVTDVMFGAADAGCLPFNTRGQLGFDADLCDQVVFDLDEAKALFAEANAANLSFGLVTSTQINPALTKIAEILQADLASIGVKMTIEDVDSASFREQASKGLFPQALLQLVGRSNLDPDTTFNATTAWRAAKNASRFENADYQRLVKEAGSILDERERAVIYRQINELILRENFVMPVVTNPKPWVGVAGVTGVEAASNGQPIMEYVSITK